ncbi:MAG: hypothetical protein ACRDIY_05180 [Chloroflexota bacterium]
MDLSGPFQVFILWAHAMAAVAWVGGSLFYVVALNPALDRVGRTPERLSLLSAVGIEFREVVRLSILVFVVTGVILAVTRLSQPRITTAYVGVLGVKVALSVWMFWLAGRLGKRREPGGAGPWSRLGSIWWLRPQYLILGLGTIIYLLSVVLRVLFDQTLGATL